MIVIDGSMGEGGGQVVRTSLALSVVTGQPVRLENIRAGRKKPGLLRQHLTGLRALTTLSDADVTGDTLGSREVTFAPRAARGGRHRFAVGSAGSANLVLQTVLPALLVADSPAELVLEGGTHNSKSPSAHFLAEAFLPLLRRMGASATLEVARWGFYPAGGGQLNVQVDPGPPRRPLHLLHRGDVRLTATAVVCNLPAKIATRELKILQRRLDIADTTVLELSGPGPGNAVWVTAETASGSRVFTGFGERGVTAERVAKRLSDEVLAWLGTDVPVDEHLADQLLLPMALARGGRFLTTAPSLHTLTNMAVIERFLPVSFTSTTTDERRWELAVQPR